MFAFSHPLMHKWSLHFVWVRSLWKKSYTNCSRVSSISINNKFILLAHHVLFAVETCRVKHWALATDETNWYTQRRMIQTCTKPQWPWCFHGFGMAEDGIASGHPSVLHVGNVGFPNFLQGLTGTLQGVNISHLGKRKIIFKMPFWGDMLVPWRVKFLKTNVFRFINRINLVILRIRAYGQRCRMPNWNSHWRWLPHWIWHTKERWRPGTHGENDSHGFIKTTFFPR